MGFINLFIFTLFTFVSHSFKSTLNLYNKFKTSNKLFNNNIITDDFVYIISHHYECDDYYYQSYCDLYRIYKTEKEAFLKIYNNKFHDKNNKYLHFKVIKYKINKINETEQFSEVLYDSYKHIINKNLQIIKRKIEKQEDFRQSWRLYDWAD